MTQRTCTVNGCDKSHRAKGLCSTHYNRQTDKANRHPHVDAPCAVCGTTTTRNKDSRRRPSCSTLCRTILQWGEQNGTGYNWSLVAATRARRMGATVVENINRHDVYERDHWLCYLCGSDTRTTTDPFHPNSATVDHVTPLSRGGQHTMDNVRCCCLHCNSSKQDALTHPA